MSLKKNDCFEAEITGMTSEGNGVARIDNIAVFVPNTVVGDVAVIKIVKVLKSYAFGIVDKLIKPSVSRVNPDCTCYTQCGGCTYRHMTYESELAVKQDFVQQSFNRLAGFDIKCEPIIGSEHVDFYRNKAQYPVALNSDGDVVCGFFAKRSHRVISSSDCKLQSHEFEEIKSEIIDFIVDNNILPYDEVTHKGEVRHIYLRKAEFTDQVMVCIVVKKSLPMSEVLVSQLTAKFKNITSIVINVNGRDTNVILGDKCKAIYGDGYITDEVCGIRVNIATLAFYQVNKLQAELLYNKALEFANLTKDDVLIDLYCGTGTIGLIAANKVNKVFGVEIIPQAIENAKENAKLNNIVNCEFICADASKATVEFNKKGIKPSVVVVDPPRKGLEPDVVDAIALMKPSRVVMISCNPTTAARDAKLFAEEGYSTKTILPVDMFPRTTHVETVVLLSHKNS